MPSADPSLSAAQRIDAACDKFESEWKAGRRPRIDDYLAAALASDRELLREALVAVETELSGRGAAETSASRSSVHSEDLRSPEATAIHGGSAQDSPTVVGRFQIRSVLGSGAFGKVYRAVDPQLGREVALKVPQETAVQTDTERAQFLKEARAAATINHPNVCQIFEVGEHAGRPYIVMALVPGQSLDETLKARKEPLPERQAALIVRKVALALAAAHDKGIVHRDLKPANVMTDRERKDIIVMDFGLARGPKVKDARATQSGVVMGTPAYMSPEQARGDSKAVGPAGDIFSLGVILYELLTGTRPFTGTATEVIGQILHVEPPPPSQRRPGINARLEAACVKAMAKDPAQRFATMKEFAAAIDAYLRESTAARPVAETAKVGRTRQEASQLGSVALASALGALADDQSQAAAEAPVTAGAATRRRTPRRVIVLVALFLVGGLAVLAGIIFFTRSDAVEVTVELKDVDLADKSLRFFLDDEPVTAEKLAERMELRPGDYVLVVKRGNNIVKRKLLTVTGGRSPGIQVTDITPPPREAKKLSPEEEDRTFAQWLLSIGASFTVSVDGGPARPVSKLVELPPGPFRVIQIFTAENQKVTDANSHHIVLWLKRTGAGVAEFHGNPIGDSTVAQLIEVKTLKWVSLALTKVTDRSLELLAGRPDLQSIDLEAAAITDKGLAHLRRLTELGNLALFNTPVTDEGLKHLVGLKKLYCLNIGRTAVTADGLRQLKALPIHSLCISATAVRLNLGVLKEFRELNSLGAEALSLTDADILRLVELKGLEKLSLQNNRVTDDGLQKLTALKKLKELNLNGDPVTEAGLARLRKGLPGCNVLHVPPPDEDRTLAEWLFSIGVSAVAISVDGGPDQVVTRLADLPQGPFRMVGFGTWGNGKVTDANCEPILRWLKRSRWERFDFNGNSIGDATVAKLVEIKTLKDFWLANTKITDHSLELIGTRSDPRSAIFDGTAITDRGLAHLRGVKNLEGLGLAATRITDEGLKALAGLQRLRGLDVRLTRVTAKGLRHLKGLPIDNLVISQSQVRPTDLEVLKDFPRLRMLSVELLSLSDAAIPLLTELKGLESLSLQGNRITDDGLQQLAALKGLKALSVLWNPVTDAGLERLRKALPGCRILPESKAADPDRAAAEWVLSVTAKEAPWPPYLRVAEPDHLPITLQELFALPEIKNVEELPKKSFKLVQLTTFGSKVSDAELARFAKLSSLQGIYLNGASISDEGLKTLAAHKGLIYLALANAWKITDRGVQHIAGLTRLQQLWLTETRVTDDGIAPVSGLVELSALTVSSPRFTGAGLKHLTKLGQLRYLACSDCPVTDAGLESIAALDRLEWLKLVRTKVTDRSVAALKKLTRLRELDLTGSYVSDAGLIALKKALPGCRITPEPKDNASTERRAAALQVLKGGGLLRIRMGDRLMDVADPSKLPAEPFTVFAIDVDLKVVHRKGTDALLALVKTHFHEIEDISFAQTDVTNMGMEHLRGMPRLQKVFLEGTGVDGRGFAALAGLQELREAWVGLTKMGNDGAKVLAGLPELRFIRAYYTGIDDEAMAILKKAPKLEHLDVFGNNITDAGLVHLKNYSALKGINLAQTKITNAGLAHLPQVKHLENLTLDETAITDAGLAHLAKCKGLKHLSLVKTKVTEQGLAELRRALPGCEIRTKANP
jgi:Leucine-rich repeat (LRR) protein